MSKDIEIEEAVIEEIRNRRDAGRKKYGTSMERTDLTEREWLQHAKEEALDLAIYLQRLIRDYDKRAADHVRYLQKITEELKHEQEDS